MNIIIVGGGKVGYYLSKSLKERKHEICVIESNKALCDKLAEETDHQIIYGDGTSIELLREAGIENADVIVAATGKDEENLIICQMAKMNYQISESIARVNNPKNIEVFKKLGVDKTICSTEVIVNMIENAL